MENKEHLNGVYLIKNKINNKMYIGSASKSFKYRWKEHTRKLNRNVHVNKYLQAAWNKYGKDNFEFIVLEVTTLDVIIKKEQFYIDTILPEYNLSPTASSMLGFKHSEESRKKMSDAAKQRTDRRNGYKWSEEAKSRVSQRKRKPLSEKHKNNIKNAMKKADLSTTIAASKLRGKKVYCLELNTTFISAAEASSTLKLSYDHMVMCIKKNKKIKNYTLRYIE